MRTLATISRWYLAGILAFAGGAKLFWAEPTKRTLIEGGMLPSLLVAPVTYALPGLEVFLALLLLIRRAELLVLLGILYLSTVFTGVHVYTAFAGVVLPCTCVGGLSVSHASRQAEVLMAIVSAAMVASCGILMYCTRKGHWPGSLGARGSETGLC